MPAGSSRNGTRDVVEWGEGGDAFVLLHASATGPHSLAALARRLLRHGDRRIIAPAFAGYGRMPVDSAARPGLVGTNRSIAVDVVREVQSRPTVLFGHSMGGLVAALAALELQRLGSPIGALVLYEPMLIDLLDLERVEHAHALDWDRGVIENLSALVGDGRPEAGVRTFVEAWNETDWEALPAAARDRLIASADNLVREARAVSHFAIDRAGLADLKTPALLLRGTRSPALVNHMTEAAAAVMPAARCAVLPDCGHMAPLLEPDRVADAMESFLQVIQSERSQ